jgi:hypothetical protein
VHPHGQWVASQLATGSIIRSNYTGTSSITLCSCSRSRVFSERIRRRLAVPGTGARPAALPDAPAVYGAAGARFCAAPVAKGAGADQEGVRRPRRAAPPAVRTRGDFDDDDDDGTARRSRRSPTTSRAGVRFCAHTLPRERMNERMNE